MPRHLPAFVVTALTLSAVLATVVAPAPEARALQPFVQLPGFSSTDQVAVDSPLHRVFVLGDDEARVGGRLLATIDSRTDEVVGSPVAVAGGDFVAVDPVSHRVFLTDSAAGTITVLDARTGSTLAVSGSLGSSIGQVVVDPYAAEIFVMDGRGRLVTLDESGRRVGPPVTIPGSGTRLAIDFTVRKIYVPTDRTIAVVDVEADRIVTSIPTADVVGAIVVDPIDGRALASTRTAVLSLDTRTDAILERRAMPADGSRTLGVDFIAHSFLVRESDTAVVTLTRGLPNRLAVDSFGAMAVDYLLHKVYAGWQNRPWVSAVWL